jgi:hypothetical protein
MSRQVSVRWSDKIPSDPVGWAWAAQKSPCQGIRAYATFIPYTVAMGLCRNPMSTVRPQPACLVGARG